MSCANFSYDIRPYAYNYSKKKKEKKKYQEGDIIISIIKPLPSHRAHSRDFCVCNCCEVDHKDIPVTSVRARVCVCVHAHVRLLLYVNIFWDSDLELIAHAPGYHLMNVHTGTQHIIPLPAESETLDWR